jgi:hypothetical protein
LRTLREAKSWKALLRRVLGDATATFGSDLIRFIEKFWTAIHKYEKPHEPRRVVSSGTRAPQRSHLCFEALQILALVALEQKSAAVDSQLLSDVLSADIGNKTVERVANKIAKRNGLSIVSAGDSG